MNELIKKYIELLFSEGNKNKRDIIINLGLLIEKNTDKENPTDYVQLLPSDLLVVNLSEEEKNERIKTLEEIKIQSENQNKDKLLIERANRIYSEIVNTEIRNYISEYLENYQMIVRTGDRIRIQKVKKEFSTFLDKIDPELNDLSVDDILRDIDEKEEDEAVEEEDELEFWN